MEGEAEIKVTGTVAPMRNVMLLNALIQRVQNRDDDLPGMACFYGPSGYGKTMAAVWSAQHHGCYWVELQSTWSVKKMMQKILTNMKMTPSGTISDMVEVAAEELRKSDRPLLIDEADLLCRESFIKAIRDIYESSRGTIILIGEENLPQTLRKWERIHNRQLDWVPAQPADLREVGLLAQLKCPGLTVTQDVHQLVLEKSHARARRIVVNLRQIAEYALKTGRKEITAEDAAKITFFTGDAPAPRRIV